MTNNQKLWSGCSGIGLERWASAFYAQKGWTLINGLRLSGRLLGNCLKGSGFCDGWGRSLIYDVGLGMNSAICTPSGPPLIILKTFITSASSIYIGSITVRLCARIAMIPPEHAPPPEPALDLSGDQGSLTAS